MKALWIVLAATSLAACTTPQSDAPDGTAGADADSEIADLAVDSADAVAPVDVVCNDCLPSVITWGSYGGYDAGSSRSSSLSGCRTYSSNFYAYGGDASVLCSNELASCTDTGAYGVGAVERALAQPEVVAALARHRAMFGADNTGSDSSLWSINVGADTIVIGDPCTADAGCTPIPPAIDDLRRFFEGLATHQEGLAGCATDGGP